MSENKIKLEVPKEVDQENRNVIWKVPSAVGFSLGRENIRDSKKPIYTISVDMSGPDTHTFTITW